ncbi:MAG: diaminopimelate decarboxylase, partial [Deltaproteobacteria bacterium]|nr:diaminopimelate decarboxylase [Nannocystaceae bacterium]
MAARAERFGLTLEADSARLRGVELAELARAVGTPTYVYDAVGIRGRLAELRRALGSGKGGVPDPLVCYAVKANSSQAVLRVLAREGAGADIVSGGELARALAAGIPPQRIVFSGVGKTDDELDAAIAAGIRSINIESAEEFGRVSARAAAAGRSVPVSLRLNPDVDPDTHPYLATGLRTSKFGIPMIQALELALRAHRDVNLRLVGLACHIGSQIVEASPYRESVMQLRSIVVALREQGVTLAQLDLGGGLGVAYRPGEPDLDVRAWGQAVRVETDELGLQLLVEPGRWLVAEAGILLTRVLGHKRGEGSAFLIVDAAMNDLLRPALYEAYHAVVPARRVAADATLSVMDVVGPVCECGDFLALARALPSVENGELMMVMGAGAYGMTMASTYNT